MCRLTRCITATAPPRFWNARSSRAIDSERSCMRISEPRAPATAKRTSASSTTARTPAHDSLLEVIARAASPDERENASRLPVWATDVLELFSTQPTAAPDGDLPTLPTLTLGELAV